MNTFHLAVIWVGLGLPWISFPWAEKVADSVNGRDSVTSKLGQDEHCRDIAPGESRTVGDTYLASATGLPRRYKITRDKDDPNQYNVELKVYFEPDERMRKRLNLSLGEDYNQKDWQNFDRNMEARANYCFERYKRFLRDSEGRTLNIRLTTHKALDPAGVPGSKIKLIDNPFHRSNSENWASGVECKTIVHETLHLLGLVDGYVEKSLKRPNGQVRWDCRVKERRESLMASGGESDLRQRGLLVTCQCTSVTCRKSLDTFQVVKDGPLTCPPGSLRQISRTSLDLSHVDHLTSSKDGTGRGITYKFLVSPSNFKPLLGKSQLMAITNPYCVRDNVYMACAKNAYRSSSDPGGCLDVPPECKQEGWPK